jgi:hypothetical protein
MDPINALGASDKFIDYVSKLVTTFVEVHRSPDTSTGNHKDLYAITKDLSQLNRGIIQSSRLHGEEHTDIIRLCHSCNNVAKELLETLEKLNRQDGTPWESFRIALRTVWSEKEITSLQQRIDGYRHQISHQMLNNIQ